MAVLKVTKDNFATVQASEKPVLLDFYADWCGPCRMVSPIVDEIAEENAQVLVGKINVDEQPELTALFKTESIPYIALVKDNTFLDFSVGYVAKATLVRLIEENK